MLAAARRTPYRLFAAEGSQRDGRWPEIARLAQDAHVVVDEVPRILLDDLTRGANHQGVAADASPYPYASLDEVVEREGTVLVLDHLQDPQNLGTLLRAAEAAQVAGVVIPQDRAVAVTAAVVNASAGAVEHLIVAKIPNLARALEELKSSGRWVIGLDRTSTSVDLFSADLPTPIALVVGSEGSGIGPNIARRCDVTISLPMRGRIESLNAATAGSIVLFELLRRELV